MIAMYEYDEYSYWLVSFSLCNYHNLLLLSSVGFWYDIMMVLVPTGTVHICCNNKLCTSFSTGIYVETTFQQERFFGALCTRVI